MERETATYTCPECQRRITVLADEYGDHGCICGWEPDEDIEDDDDDYEWDDGSLPCGCCSCCGCSCSYYEEEDEE